LNPNPNSNPNANPNPNRSESGDLEGCLEILSILRKSSIKVTQIHWELVMNSINNKEIKRKKVLDRYTMKKNLTLPLLEYLIEMEEEDGVLPTFSMCLRSLQYYSSIEDPHNVVKIIKIMRLKDFDVNIDILKELENMRRFDIVLDLLEIT
jgi:hypothetical protein